nr:atherin-like [Aegilops tauschii subsp. strangulata]
MRPVAARRLWCHLAGAASPPRPDIAPRLALRPAAALAPCSSPAPPGDPAAVDEPPAGDDLPPSRPCHGLLLTGPHHRPSPRPPRLLLADDASPSSFPKAPPSLAAPCSPTHVRTPVLLLLPVPSRRRSAAPPHHPLAAGSHRTARRARRRFPHSPPSLRGLAPLLPLRRCRYRLLLRPASLAVAGLASAQSG